MRVTFDTTNRKDLVAAIAEVTGFEKKYLGVPKCNYQVGPFIVDKNCELTCDDKELSTLELTIERLAENHSFHGMIEEFPEEETQQEEEKRQEENVGITVSVPLANVSLGNLINLLEAKGELIQKALGIPRTYITEEDEVVKFAWFENLTPEEANTYSKFIAALCKMSLEQKRISAKAKEYENEKFAASCFDLALSGMSTKQTESCFLEISPDHLHSKIDRRVVRKHENSNCSRSKTLEGKVSIWHQSGAC